MTRAQTIVERLLARRPSVNEGLEGTLASYLATLGFHQGQDFYFDNGLHIDSPELVDKIVSALNDSGRFGSASAESGHVSFEPIDGGGEGGELSHWERDARMQRLNPPEPSPTVDPDSIDPETLTMCDNCGSKTHHTEECHFGRLGQP